jgi:hypothetical protein
LEEPQKGQYRFAPGYSLDWENLCKRTLYLFVCSVMFRASVLKQLPPMDETLLTGDDFKLLVSLFCKGFDKVSLLPECTYLYRNYAGSITKNPTRLMKVSESHIALTEWFFSLPEMPANLQRLKGYHLSHRLAVLTSTLTKMNRPDLSVPTQLRQLTSQLLRRQAADYFGQRTEGQSALPTATAALP